MAKVQASIISGVFNKPFAEQVAFFRNKLGNLVPTKRWDDLKHSAHDRGFMVAGAAKADLLADLAAAVDRGIVDGQSYNAFRKDFRAIVKQRGWHGWTGEGSKAGRAWRMRIIYDTNMNTSYAAGRLAQLREGKFPFWVYNHNDSVTHPRPLHKAWNGMVIPSDAMWWKSHYPPNGFGCRCYVSGASSKAAARRLGGDPDKKPDPAWLETDPKTGAPVGIGKGWDYAPGDSVSDVVNALAKKTATLPPEIGVAYGASISKQMVASYAGWIDSVLADAVVRGRDVVLASMSVDELSFLKAKGKAPVRADISLADRLVIGKKAARHQQAGNGLTAKEWQSLAVLMQGEKAVLYDNGSGNILYVLPSLTDKNIKIVVKPDYFDKKAKQTVASTRTVFKVGKVALQDAKKYTVISGVIK